MFSSHCFEHLEWRCTLTISDIVFAVSVNIVRIQYFFLLFQIKLVIVYFLQKLFLFVDKYFN